MINYQKIALVFSARLGDTLFCTPAVKLIKKYLPHIQLTAIALSPLAAETLQGNPDLDAIYLAPKKKQIKKIADANDITINLHSNPKLNDYLSSCKIKFIPAPLTLSHQHQTAQTLEFIASALNFSLTQDDYCKYVLPTQDSHRKKIINLLTAQDIKSNRDILIGLHLGCHGLAKRDWRFWKLPKHKKVWTITNFLALANKLQQKNPHIHFVLTGSRNEEMLAKHFLAKQPSAINLVNKTSVHELAALMSHLKVFVVSDTGALHVACSTNVDIVALFGPTNLQRTGPYPMQANYTVIQAATMAEISTQQVYEAVIQSSAMQDINF